LKDPQAFLRELESLALPASGFDHQFRLFAAWAYRRCYPAGEAAARCAASLSRNARAQGRGQDYHHTLTMALLAIMYHRVDTKPVLTDNWGAFLAANPDIVSDATQVLNEHYSEDKLQQAVARKIFIEPDLKPLPVACLLP
jgi:hypothetical protein